MIKKSVSVEIDSKEASLTPKEASFNSSQALYCHKCNENVIPILKMGDKICPTCRIILTAETKDGSER